MRINLTDVLSCEGKAEERTVPGALAVFDAGFGSYPLTEQEPLFLKLTNLGEKKLRIEGTARYGAVLPCDRCLADVATDLPLSFSWEVDLKESAEDRVQDLDETDFIDGYYLDTEKLVKEELLAVWPMKVLCRPDCKGLCRKCGHNLNEGDCGCDRTELDPRMAVIAELFKNQKEQ